MEMRDRILGPVSVQPDVESSIVRVDYGAFVRNLILSEQFILEAGLLEDFPPLLAKFGYDGMAELLQSRRVRVLADFFACTQAGQTELLDGRREKGILPLGSYSLSVVSLHDLEEHIHHGMAKINEVPGLTAKQSKRIRKLIANRLISPSSDKGKPTVEQTNRDIVSNSLLARQSIAMGAREHFQLEVSPADFTFSAEMIDDADIRTETDLGVVLGLDPETTHKVVERGLLGLAGLNQRIEFMERYQAVTGFKVDEISLFEEKLGFLARQLDPDAARERLDRVIEILGLPDADADPDVHDVDLARLVEVIQTDEAKEFRQWLRGVDSLDDEEVRQQISRVRELLAHAVHGTGGKAVRFATGTGLGFVFAPAAIGFSALDTFVTDKVLREDGPTTFLGRLYPSVFR
jgi:hypothetical protein